MAVENSCIDAWWEKDGDIILVENTQRWFLYIDDCSVRLRQLGSHVDGVR